jgi:hypothetical protein
MTKTSCKFCWINAIPTKSKALPNIHSFTGTTANRNANQQLVFFVWNKYNNFATTQLKLNAIYDKICKTLQKMSMQNITYIATGIIIKDCN